MTGSSEQPSNGFDLLARAAAQGLSRRQALRATLALAIAAVLPESLIPAPVARAGIVGVLGNCATPTPGTCKYGIKPYSKGCDQPVANGNASTFNGCGPESGIDLKEVLHPWLPHTQLEPPDSPLWLADFAEACNGHDCCYGKCGASKQKCDEDFKAALLGACRAKHGSDGILDTALIFYCNMIAHTYYNAVAKKGGDAFDIGQSKVCNCCCDCEGCANKVEPLPNGTPPSDGNGCAPGSSSPTPCGSQCSGPGTKCCAPDVVCGDSEDCLQDASGRVYCGNCG